MWGWILPPGTVVTCPFWWDAGLRVTLTLLPVRPGLGQSFCFSLSVKGEPGNLLGFPGSRPHRQFLHVALGQPCVAQHPSARLGWGTPSSSTEYGTPSPCRAAERGWQVLA